MKSMNITKNWKTINNWSKKLEENWKEKKGKQRVTNLSRCGVGLKQKQHSSGKEGPSLSLIVLADKIIKISQFANLLSACQRSTQIILSHHNHTQERQRVRVYRVHATVQAEQPRSEEFKWGRQKRFVGESYACMERRDSTSDFMLNSGSFLLMPEN